MEAIQNIFQKLAGGGIDLNLGGSAVAPNYLQAFGIVVFIFLFVLVLAKMSRGYLSWYTMGWYIWVVLGFLLALVIEGLFIVHGSTILTEVFRWKNAPKPFSVALDRGKERLVDVLGESDKVNGLQSVDEVIRLYQSLPTQEAEKIEEVICTP